MQRGGKMKDCGEKLQQEADGHGDSWEPAASSEVDWFFWTGPIVNL